VLAIKLPYGLSRLFCGKNSSIRYYIDVYDAFARALSNLKYCEHQGERMILFKKVGRVASSFNCAPSSDFTLQSSETYYVMDGVVVIWRFTNGATLYRFVVRLLKMITRSISSVQGCISTLNLCDTLLLKFLTALRQSDSLALSILC